MLSLTILANPGRGRDTALTDREIIDDWLASKNPGTARVYGPVVEDFRQAMGKPLADVTPPEAHAWLTRWADQEPATRARKIRTLRSLYRYGQAAAGWPVNPFYTVRDPKIPEGLADRIPQPDEVWALMAAAQAAGPRMGAIVTFIFGTGCRISELTAASWGDIERTPDGHWIWHVATRTPATPLPLRAEIVAALGAWRGAQGRPPLWAADDETLLFPMADGRPSHPAALTTAIRRLAVKAGLEHAIPPHWLRHAHAGMALEHGATVELVQRTLGHRRITSTARYLSVVKRPASSADVLPWGPPLSS